MKILAITNLYPPYVLGGYELLAQKTMRALKERGHEVFIATGKGSQLPVDAHLFGVYDLDLDRKEDEFLYHVQGRFEELKKQLFHSGNYRTTQTLITEVKPDVVSVWNLYKMSISPLIAARRAQAPTVTHLTDRWLLLSAKDILASRPHIRRIKRLGLRAIRATVQPALYRLTQPDNLIIPSISLRDTYVDAGFPADAFHLVPHGIEVERFPYLRREPRQVDEPVLLLYVGQLWEGKGVHILLRALGHLKRSGTHSFLLNIYGTGASNFIDHLRTIVLEEDLQDHVQFCGTVPYDDLASVYHAHDVLIFPSIWNEPFALVPLEAMATGLPIVASDAGGTKEAVRHEQTGLVVPTNEAKPMADAIRKLIDDEASRLRLGQQAAAVVRAEYDFEKMVDRVEAFYMSLKGSNSVNM